MIQSIGIVLLFAALLMTPLVAYLNFIFAVLILLILGVGITLLFLFPYQAIMFIVFGFIATLILKFMEWKKLY